MKFSQSEGNVKALVNRDIAVGKYFSYTGKQQCKYGKCQGPSG